MHRWSTSLFLVVGAVFSNPVEAVRIEASYVVQVAGLPVVDLTLTLDLREGGYTVEAASRTRGTASVFLPGHQHSRSEGVWHEEDVVPKRFRSDGLWRGTPRHTQLDYDGGQPAITVLDPSEADLRFPVRPEQLKDTKDPLSAIASFARQVGRTGRCDGQMSIFAGRERQEVSVRNEGSERIDGGGAGWSGDALRCSFESRTVAGLLRDQPRATAGRPETGTVWFGSPLPDVMIPVRVEIPIRWLGKAVIRLVNVEVGQLP